MSTNLDNAIARKVFTNNEALAIKQAAACANTENLLRQSQIPPDLYDRIFERIAKRAHAANHSDLSRILNGCANTILQQKALAVFNDTLGENTDIGSIATRIESFARMQISRKRELGHNEQGNQAPRNIVPLKRHR